MRILYSDRYTIELPPGHRFPMRKYALLRDRLAAGGSPLMRFEEAAACGPELLHLAHDPDYVARVLEGRLSPVALRRLGLPWSSALVERSLRAVGATVSAVRYALQDGIAVNLAGGTHHADSSTGAGFCVFNDAAIAALAQVRAEPALRIAIIDCDVHQGDGTARILERRAGVYVFSLHSARNFPHIKASSDCDIGLPDACGDEHYLYHLDIGLDFVLATSGARLVIYNAGADPYDGDQLGRLAVSKDGLARRDRLVLTAAERFGAAVAVVMGGGYSADPQDAVDIHHATVLEALASFRRRRGLPAQCPDSG